MILAAATLPQLLRSTSGASDQSPCSPETTNTVRLRLASLANSAFSQRQQQNSHDFLSHLYYLLADAVTLTTNLPGTTFSHYRWYSIYIAFPAAQTARHRRTNTTTNQLIRIYMIRIYQITIQRMHEQSKAQNVEIDMSTLSAVQKKMCVQLLAHSNIQFQQRDHEFVAQIKIDPTQLPKSNNSASQITQKTKTEPKREILNGGKKTLSRTVKIGQLRKLESLHRTVQIYIYPKRLSGITLCELVEGIYEKFWSENKKKSTQIRNINFPEWVYRQIVLPCRDKLRVEQFLVNLIDSLNHFQNKIPGLRLFHSFLAQKLPIDALFYFLVLRGLLEQVIGQRILEKNTQNSAGIMPAYKLKLNPYERSVSEEEMLTFLKVLFSGGLSCSRSKPKAFEQVHQGLTNHMFFDQQRKKNYIYFFDLLEQLILEFMDSEASSCDMSLSKTNLDQPISLSELITDQLEEPLFPKNNTTPPPSHYILELQPAEQEKALQRQRQEEPKTDKNALETAVLHRVEDMYSKLRAKPSQTTLNAIDAIIQAVGQYDKSIWVRFREEQVSESELFSIERLQTMLRKIQGGTSVKAVLQPVVKGVLLLPVLRQLICDDINL